MAQLSGTALAFQYLLGLSGVSKHDLAGRLGLADARLLSRYENGDKPLSPDHLIHLAAELGFKPEAVDALSFAHRLIVPPRLAEPASPVTLTAEEWGQIDRTALTAGWTAADSLRVELVRHKRKEKAAAARTEAKELLGKLREVDSAERRELVEIFPEFRGWAVAEAACHESERLAAHKPALALEWAELALFIAERTPGEESWRARLQGYCWAFIANALRVANDHDGADEAFDRTWELWRAGADSDPELLAESRLFDLEASLRRAERRFPEALALLGQALERVGGGDLEVARILLKKEHVFEAMGDVAGALTALREAAPRVAACGDPRFQFLVLHKTVKSFNHLELYAEAAERLPELRELALRQPDAELDLLRVLWVSGNVADGLGRAADAMAALEQVQREFTLRELPYDAALVSLELAVLWLQAGRSAEVRGLAAGMAWIFRAKKIHREALAALTLFCEAAAQEAATVELARRTKAEIERLRQAAPSTSADRPMGRG
jgi:transcriptional regulator with XRE-family HTH domain